MTYLHTSINLDNAGIDAAEIYGLNAPGGGVYPIVEFGGLALMPAKGENLVSLLHRLADRIDAAISGDDDTARAVRMVA
jgi:hypothetical protein